MLWAAFKDLLDQEFSWSSGHLTALVNGCVFAPALLTFWFVNGITDFSTALLLGTVRSPAELYVRLIAYLLVVPAFILVRAGYYMIHPLHRKVLFSGSCPQSQILSLDWFTVGILVTGLPMALEQFGLWVVTNLLLFVGIFLLPRVVSTERHSIGIKAGTILLAGLLFLYVKIGPMVATAVGVVPDPAAVLGPVVTFALSQQTLNLLMRLMNSLVTGPPLVAAVSYVLNWILTHPELTDIPIIRHTLPRRDPWQAVIVSASLGTVFYLLFRGLFAGELVIVP